MATTKRLGFGLVGCGVIGPTHCEAIKAVEGAKLLAVCDAEPTRAADLAARYGVAWYSDLTDFLSHPGLEVVNVAVPSGYHARIGIQVARSGKHLLVEKPIEVSLEAADRLIAECEQAGVKLGVISQCRFAPDVLKVRQAILAGEFGPLVLGEASIKWYRSQEYYDSGEWRGTLALDGGGALMNQGIHYIDLLQWIMGPVAGVKAYTTTRSHRLEVEDLAVAVLRFASGAVGTITGSTSIYPGLPERLELHGRDATAIIEANRLTGYYLRSNLGEAGRYGFSPAQLKNLTANQPPETEQATEDADGPGGIGTNAHARQVADFVAAIQSGRDPLVTGREARRSLELILAIYRAAQEGQEVGLHPQQA